MGIVTKRKGGGGKGREGGKREEEKKKENKNGLLEAEAKGWIRDVSSRDILLVASVLLAELLTCLV